MSEDSKFIKITKAYVPLGFITFGGPAAHVALLMVNFVEKQKWLTERTFAELFAISQSLPGPSSTQLAYAIALVEGGPLLAVYSFFLWSIPMFIVMTASGIGIQAIPSSTLPQWAYHLQNGLTSAAIGLVALAAYKLSSKLINSKLEHLLLLIAASCTICIPNQPWLLPALMIFGGTVCVFAEFVEKKYLKKSKLEEELVNVEDQNGSSNSLSMENLEVDSAPDVYINYTAKASLMIFIAWITLLLLSIYLRTLQIRLLNVLGTFFFTGSIIFGGGPVVIPLLSQFIVANGWLSEAEFLIGLAIINSLPGPMFNFAAFCGALSVRDSIPMSILSAFFAYLGVFSPGLMLQSALIPIWSKYRQLDTFKLFFKGVNASATGLIYAAVYFLCQKALVGLIENGIVNTYAVSINGHPFFIVISSTSFVLSGFMNIPTPIVILLGGLVGFLSYFAS